MLEELKMPVAQLKEDIMGVWGRLDADSIQKKIDEKMALTEEPGFWDDHEKAEKIMAQVRKLKNRVEPWKQLLSEFSDLEAMYELAAESGEKSDEDEVRSMLEAGQKKFEELNVLNLLSGEVDDSSAFLSVHSGAGGTEAEDWARMLSRMYTRWAERHDFKIEVVDVLEAEGGIKSITMQIDGDYVYGHLKGEAGIHRLVRISPFDANARRHTSFASVYVFPVLDDSIEVEIKPEDLRVDTYRAGGKGGQHVNKTDSAVRFTHLPTGIVVACQSERSQIFNRQACMSMLRARLYEYYREQKEKENAKFGAEKKDISWGNQIRSYVFQPYTMVKDHRTKCESGNIQAVMDGDIDQFMDSFLVAQWKGLPMDSGDDDEEM
ncbi:MAG: peptide chain release factor 2 [Spirochaetia bacterium]|nr:peptide chain release factor 2 [Treponema sp.]MCI6316423.1 peptide chain release factor 2 [Spirochaetia bacterium]MBQ5907623.1 peptide chain release factor 2 [Treponema sp.]MBR0545012.1 peptide chain release factor 2 [Treponema sp.]MCI6366244.1 peptide chain release factor 2 [Spirochaetia bacterium]